ncbi:hypothetical protein GCM10009558_044750 [Virgisporangium aurantiacum]
MEAIEPTLPMDSTEPWEPIDSRESVDHSDKREEPVEDMSGLCGTPVARRPSAVPQATRPDAPGGRRAGRVAKVLTYDVGRMVDAAVP